MQRETELTLSRTVTMIQFQRQASFSPMLRLLIYAYLTTPELIKKAAKLSRQERKALDNSNICNRRRSLTFILHKHVLFKKNLDKAIL